MSRNAIVVGIHKPSNIVLIATAMKFNYEGKCYTMFFKIFFHSENSLNPKISLFKLCGTLSGSEGIHSDTFRFILIASKISTLRHPGKIIWF